MKPRRGVKSEKARRRLWWTFEEEKPRGETRLFFHQTGKRLSLSLSFIRSERARTLSRVKRDLCACLGQRARVPSRESCASCALEPVELFARFCLIRKGSSSREVAISSQGHVLPKANGSINVPGAATASGWRGSRRSTRDSDTRRRPVSSRFSVFLHSDGSFLQCFRFGNDRVF